MTEPFTITFYPDGSYSGLKSHRDKFQVWLQQKRADDIRELAKKVRGEWLPSTCPWVGYLDDEADRIESTDEV